VDPVAVSLGLPLLPAQVSALARFTTVSSISAVAAVVVLHATVPQAPEESAAAVLVEPVAK
jgi:hypothetical protein